MLELIVPIITAAGGALGAAWMRREAGDSIIAAVRRVFSGPRPTTPK